MDSWQLALTKKNRLLVSCVPHFKDNFSLLRFEEELSGKLGRFLPPMGVMNSINGLKSNTQK